MIHNPGQAYNCYVLFAPMYAAQELMASEMPSEAGNANRKQLFAVYLINLAGQVVHSWQVPLIPLQGHLLPNGNIMIIGLDPNRNIMRPRDSIRNRMGGYVDHILELDWDGNTVFKYAAESMHGDCIKLDNGNYLYLKWELVPDSLRHKVKGGLKDSEYMPPAIPPPVAMHDTTAGARRMFNDSLIEINAKGDIVWTWHANEHLDPEIDIIGAGYRREEWLSVNSIGIWKENQLLLTSRNTDSILIVDRQTGNIDLRWGNNAYLDKSTGQIKYHEARSVGRDKSHGASTHDATLSSPHDARRISAGYPGAGHITVYSGFNSDSPGVIEFDPASRESVWQFSKKGNGQTSRLEKPDAQFLSSIGSAQRLPNGNTLICEGVDGRLFQVTPNKKVVWEYVNPYRDSKVLQGAVYKAQAYAPDYCPQFKTVTTATGTTVKSMGSADNQKTNNSASNPKAAPQSILPRLLVAFAALTLLISIGYYFGRRLAQPRTDIVI